MKIRMLGVAATVAATAWMVWLSCRQEGVAAGAGEAMREVVVPIAAGPEKLAAVESFDRFLPVWFRKHHGREPRGGDLSVYGMAGMFAANGRVVMAAKTAPGRLAIWSYDPAADRWGDAAIETKAYPVQATPSLAIDEEFIYRIEADRLAPVARRPRRLVPPNWQTRMALTSRYLYVRLPWGLLRVARMADVAG